MKNIVVIGANFGDETKGKSVDFFAKQSTPENTLNIRFSGSNNAGHTVWCNGKSFVFHLLGAASFRKVPTYLSQHVVVDFVSLYKEMESFFHLTGYRPTVYVDPRCRVNLPYDVMINRVKELIRGDGKHGSTGNGLNETIDRHQKYPLVAGQFLESYKQLELIRENFIAELKNLVQGITNINLDEADKKFINKLLSEDCYSIFSNIRDAIDWLNLYVETPKLSDFNCIFEGSQGLALDEYSKYFPHVTRSRTGTTNVIDICREHNIVVDDVYYVSRPYLSRHGADKFFEECTNIDTYFKIVDPTNINNRWQDSLKFALLDIDEMENRISSDFNVLKHLYPYANQHRIFSCMDQCIDGKGAYLRHGDLYQPDDLKRSLKMLYSLRKLSSTQIIFFDNKENV